MKLLTACFFLILTACSGEPAADEATPSPALPGDGPQYVNGTDLVRPAEYREWPFLGSGLDLNYDEEASRSGGSVFTNVFVNPSAYRGFVESGTWPDPSVFVLEFRRADTDAAPNRGGRFQGDLLALEAEVKDARFPDGWAFYNFGRAPALTDTAAPLAGEAAAPCVECHTNNTAVERTFVQFYPTLMEVAREKGTVKAGF